MNTRALYQNYLDAGLVLVAIKPGSKRPIPDPVSGSWWRIDNHAELTRLLDQYPDMNVALLCDGIVQIDADSDPAIEWCRLRGIDQQGNWAIRTARGIRFLFKAPAGCPSSFVDPDHQLPDMLALGSLAMLPPSIHPSGIRYAWVEGHSPTSINLNDLAVLPTELLNHWQQLKPEPVAISAGNFTTSAPDWLSLIFEAICRHLENTGHLIRLNRQGGFITTCPFHDDRNPSLSVHPVKGWKCWAGCGEGRLTNLAARLEIRITEHE
ncbi:bifunctional DNA primase/polymerase [Dehalogenimonas alkenigignens]|uniref:bifunctional DNA primase/polymerase n=1 Tax=Dehalogenimonas alkenigignens TaxID=1217799 RepID=UPI0014041BBE|nr:bifunctional DNA primase/polymerase [Dehalogenimonas alkenigignens]